MTYIARVDTSKTREFHLSQIICARRSAISNMLESTDCALVATSLVLSVGTIVSVSIQLERQYETVGRLNASKCECLKGSNKAAMN